MPEVNTVCKDKLMAIVASVVFSIASAAFCWTWAANVELKLLRAEIQQMKADKRQDDAQDKHIKNLWHYGGYLEQEIDRVRFKAGMEPRQRPDFDY